MQDAQAEPGEGCRTLWVPSVTVPFAVLWNTFRVSRCAALCCATQFFSLFNASVSCCPCWSQGGVFPVPLPHPGRPQPDPRCLSASCVSRELGFKATETRAEAHTCPRGSALPLQCFTTRDAAPDQRTRRVPMGQGCSGGARCGRARARGSWEFRQDLVQSPISPAFWCRSPVRAAGQEAALAGEPAGSVSPRRGGSQTLRGVGTDASAES